MKTLGEFGIPKVTDTGSYLLQLLEKPIAVWFFTACRNAHIASAVLATAIPSVYPSVRDMPVLCQNDGM